MVFHLGYNQSLECLIKCQVYLSVFYLAFLIPIVVLLLVSFMSKLKSILFVYNSDI